LPIIRFMLTKNKKSLGTCPRDFFIKFDVHLLNDAVYTYGYSCLN
jgi:hypothetical protein